MPRKALGICFSVALVIGLLRFASANDDLLYQLFLLLVPSLAAAIWYGGRDHATVVRYFALGLVGLALLVSVALRPTLEARGYLLAAPLWIGLFVTQWLAEDRQLLRALFLLLICLGTAEAAYGLVQAVGGVDQIGTYARGAGRLASGTFINRNHFAGLLNMTIGLAVGALYAGFAERREAGLRRSETYAWAWLMIVACGVLGLALLLSLSRAGALILVAMLFFIYVLLLLEPRQRRRHALPARAAMLVLVATVAFALASGINALIERFTRGAESGRVEIYRDTVSMIGDHPWIGVGPGMYRWRFRPYQTAFLEYEYHQTHDDYLQMAAEWGIPVALAFWAFVAWRLVRAVKLFLSGQSAWRRGIGLGAAAAIFSIVLHSLVDFNLQIPANALVFAVIVGLGWAAELPRPDNSRRVFEVIPGGVAT